MEIKCVAYIFCIHSNLTLSKTSNNNARGEARLSLHWVQNNYR
ncbi:unnamed protein product [Brassica oleracea]